MRGFNGGDDLEFSTKGISCFSWKVRKTITNASHNAHGDVVSCIGEKCSVAMVGGLWCV